MTSGDVQLLTEDGVVVIIGFALSILWGYTTKSKITFGLVRILAIAWIGIAIFAVAVYFVMRPAS